MSVQIAPPPDKELGKRDGACYTLGFVRAAGGEVITEDPIKKHSEVVAARGNHKILKGGGQCWIENKAGVRVAGPWKETGLFIAHGYLKRLEGEAGPAPKQAGTPFPTKKPKEEPDVEPERHRTLTSEEKGKAEDIYEGIGKSQPGMSEEKKARIAMKQGKKGKQEQGPPYTAPLSTSKHTVTREGLGVGGPRQQTGGADECVCPKCGATAPHERGEPCTAQTCPQCSSPMAGAAGPKKEVEEPITELGCTPPKKYRDKGDSEKDGEGEHEDLAQKRLEELTEE